MWYLIVSIPDLCNLTYFVVVFGSRLVPLVDITHITDKLLKGENQSSLAVNVNSTTVTFGSESVKALSASKTLSRNG